MLPSSISQTTSRASSSVIVLSADPWYCEVLMVMLPAFVAFLVASAALSGLSAVEAETGVLPK